jgi:A/G-specific adenine glycosylase
MQNPVLPLRQWYAAEGRDLPWRHTRDPYAIWLSEVILQQTRIDQGMAYYHRFLQQFPTVHALADADTDTVMKAWEGLGYYSRARNLHATAQHISRTLGGEFPRDYVALMTLKGIGPYTARAIGSFAFDNPVGVLDGNVFRVLSRYLGDASPIDAPATRKAFQAILDSWLDTETAADFNQAMMDLGAMVCTPRQPACATCPLTSACAAQREGLQAQLPVKGKKLSRKTVHHHFFLVLDAEDRLLIRRRPADGLWPNLWELPNAAVSEAEWQRADLDGYELLGAFKHVFTHLDMLIKVYRGSVSPLPADASSRWIHRREVAEFGFSRAVLKIFQAYLPDLP